MVPGKCLKDLNLKISKNQRSPNYWKSSLEYGSYGVQIFEDGSAWVSSSGIIWEYKDDHWQQYILPNASLDFTHFTQMDDGTIYGVSGEDVYQFQGTEFLHEGFGIYWRKGFTFHPTIQQKIVITATGLTHR